MKKITGSALSVLVTLTLLLQTLLVKASTEPYENFIRGKLKKNDTLIVKDEKFKNAAFNWKDITNYSVTNAVTLQLVDDIKITQQFHATARLEIQYFSTPEQQTPTVVNNVDLNVNYVLQQGAVYKITDTYPFSGAHYIKVIVKDISSPELGTDLPAYFQLSASIVVDRQYKFDPLAPIRPIVTFVSGDSGQANLQGRSAAKSSSGGASANRLVNQTINADSTAIKLDIPVILGAQEYDLEWTVVDSLGDHAALIKAIKEGPTLPSVESLNQLFRSNATRITTHANVYTISLVYNGDYLLTRVRGVSYDANGIRIEGAWDYLQANSTYAMFGLKWYQRNLNWQFSAAFAEEGKKKEVVSYFDGTLRSRQSVTINNTNNTPVIQENVYDQFGRQAASILPAPFVRSAPGLIYEPNFNKNGSNQGYSFKDLVDGTCEINPGALSNTSGAAKYYSLGSDFATSDPYIPQAGGFPLSVTQYTPDNTGRIKVQGGVGQTFQPGTVGANHTTKYFYGKPEQWELDKMFGNDVGYADHYQKNMVMDPNGQISISYLNASGKTIATALSGDTLLTPNLSGLQTAKAGKKSVTTKVLVPSQFAFKVSNLIIAASTSHLVSVPGSGQFTYNFDKIVHSYGPGVAALCSHCDYQLSIKISNDCGEVVDSTSIRRVPITGSAFQCTPGQVDSSFTVLFAKAGEYHIDMELSLSKNKVEYYVDAYISRAQANGSVKKEANFVFDAVNAIDFTGCFEGCDAVDKLGTLTAFSQMVRDKLLATGVSADALTPALDALISTRYNTLKTAAESMEKACDLRPCDRFEIPMKLDVSPGGQYARFDAAGNALEISTNLLFQYFRVVFNVRANTDAAYIAEQFTTPNGVVTSPYDAGFTLADLVKYWKDSWADKFLAFHPELCQLDYCRIPANKPVFNWDEILSQKVNSSCDLYKVIYPRPISPPNTCGITNYAYHIFNNDPFFNGTGALGASYKDRMKADLDHYSTRVLKINNFSMTEKSITAMVDYLLYCSPNGSTSSPNSAWNSCSVSASCRVVDREIQMFKRLYLDLKEKYYVLARKAACPLACDVGNVVIPEPEPSCETVGNKYLVNDDYYGPDAYTDSFLGTYMIFTVVAGAPSVMPSFDCYQDYTLYAASFYPCLTITNSSGYNKTYYSVWLITCEHDPNGGWSRTASMDKDGGNCSFISSATLPSSFERSYVANTNSVPTCDDQSAMSASRVQGETYEVDESTLQLYSVKRLSKADVVMADAANARKTNGHFRVTMHSKKGFGSYRFHRIFKVHLPGVTQKKYRNVWVAQFTPKKGSMVEKLQQAGIAKADTGATVVTISDLVMADQVAAGNAQKADKAIAFRSESVTVDDGNGGVNANFFDDEGYLVCPPELANHKANFQTGYIHPVLTEADLNDSLSIAQTKINQFAIDPDAADANADAYMRALQEGINRGRNSTTPFTSTEIVNLKTALRGVYLAGADADHLNGASVLAVPNSAGDISFGAAITRVLNVPFSTWLNPWLIEGPMPYNVKQQTVETTVSATSQQMCDRLTALRNHYGTDAATATAMGISTTDLQVFIDGCGQCKYILKKDMVLPQALQPGSKGCITRGSIDSARTVLFAAVAGLSTQPTSDVYYQRTFTNFMNQRFGYALSFDDYDKFYTTNAGNNSAILCNTPPFSAAVLDKYACVKDKVSQAGQTAEQLYAQYIAEQRDLFRSSYIGTCAGVQPKLSLKADEQIYHYTLYYYDQADNLVRTIPPEGVSLLSDTEVGWVQQARSLLYNPAACGATGGMVDSTAAFSKLTSVIAGGGKAMEFWFFTDNSNVAKQFVRITNDKQTLFRMAVQDGVLGLDIFKMDPAANNSYTSFVNASRHYRVAIPADMLPLYPWSHVMVQNSAGILAGGIPQIYLNGRVMTVTESATPMPGSFSVRATANGVDYSTEYSTLKHLRFYNNILTPAEILANANSNCFTIEGSANSKFDSWYRFNVPAAGGPTTIAANSNSETRIYPIYPDHGLSTTYVYNSTNQVIMQKSPDGGTNRFWYDILSRLVISKNDKQTGTLLSYTGYDKLGRIIETGQSDSGVPLPVNGDVPGYLDANQNEDFVNSGIKSDRVKTFYDEPLTGYGLPTVTQNNLRKRVSGSLSFSDEFGTPSATYYDYDINGNVKTLYRNIQGLGMKRLDYEYDLISGKVNFVAYQKNQADQFYYKYDYDAENRLIRAWTAPQASLVSYGIGSSLNTTTRRKDASYYYYPHGPLKRMELGDDDHLGRVQGLDYAYTLQGWLKAVNGNELVPGKDMGNDGNSVAKDAIAYSLNYFEGDYSPINGGTNVLKMAYTQNAANMTGRNLFNGNISGSTVAIKQINSDNPVGYTYGYDQLNRMVKMRQHTLTNNTTNWDITSVSNTAYKEDVLYDGNGNIKTYNRNSATALMDKLNYDYKYTNNKLENNRLRSVIDSSNTTSNAGEFTGQANYGYDAIGNLTSDSQAGITNIDWSVFGKMKTITKSSGSINYKYDAAGNRESKTIGSSTTYYVRDATGNTMAVYDNAHNTINWKEQHLYGSSRLGMFNPNMVLTNNNAIAIWDSLGHKQYELKNHLGNVLATISDKRTLLSSFYTPDVTTAQDYYPFGMLQPGRRYAQGGVYRYGFNGKENDNDVEKGIGNQQDYGMRIYDPRVGKFLSVDPLTKEYAALTPYQFASNIPTAGTDRDGLEFEDTGLWAAQKNRKYEADLYKSDPKHAEAIIRQHNITAFVSVGSMLTAGSGTLATSFMDLLMVAGTARTAQGIINHDKAKINEGVGLMTDAAMAEIGGFVIGKTFQVIIPYFKTRTTLIFEPFEGGSTYVSSGKKMLGNYNYSAEKGLELDLDIPKELQGKGLGSKIFSAAVKETGAKKFTATWVRSGFYENGMSANLQSYYAAIKNGASETEAAWATWSGSQAKEAGFKNVTIKTLNGGVEATFTK